MDWLKNLITSKPHIAIAFPAMLSTLSFFGNLFTFLSDGKIDNNELHQLLSSANGFETLVLLVIMFALKEKKK